MEQDKDIVENKDKQIFDNKIQMETKLNEKVDKKRKIHINAMIDYIEKMDKYLIYINAIISNPQIYNDKKQAHWEKEKEHWKNRHKYWKSEKYIHYSEKYNVNKETEGEETKLMGEQKNKEEEILKKEEQLKLIKEGHLKISKQKEEEVEYKKQNEEQLKIIKQKKGKGMGGERPHKEEEVEYKKQKELYEKEIYEKQLKIIQQKEEEKRDMLNCLICCERQKCVILKPCNHCYLCLECAKDVKECGLCRGQVIGYEKIYL
jgi:hypothetical protein